MAQTDEESEESDWLEKLRCGGRLELLDVEDSDMGWSCPPGHFFQVRGVDYLRTKVKVDAEDWLLKPLAFDWMRSSKGRIDQVVQHPNNRVMQIVNKLSRDGESQPFVWCINLQVPSKEHFSLIVYFVSTEPFPEGSLIDRFVKGDDVFRKERLKLIANIVKGPWFVKTAVGDHAICLLGKSLTCKYYQGTNFMEIDVDIGSSIVANAIIHLAIGYVTSLTVDLAFLIEGRTDAELPEKLLGAVRFSSLELDAAVPLEVEVEVALERPPEEDEVVESRTEGEDSLSARLWKSIGQGWW